MPISKTLKMTPISQVQILTYIQKQNCLENMILKTSPYLDTICITMIACFKLLRHRLMDGSIFQNSTSGSSHPHTQRHYSSCCRYRVCHYQSPFMGSMCDWSVRFPKSCPKESQHIPHGEDGELQRASGYRSRRV